ncbi:MAG: PA2779 family protein [Bdellovibrionales bacterium]
MKWSKRWSKTFRIHCAIVMAFMISNIPHLAVAEMAGEMANETASEMIPTSAVVDELSRSEAQAKIEGLLQREDMQDRLLSFGLSREEVNARLASLSDREMQDLASQMDRAMYGGDVTGVLLIVVLVLLIIYLAKRI